MCIEGYSYFLSRAVLKHCNQRRLKEGRICLTLPGHSPSGQELNQEREAETMEDASYQLQWTRA